MKTTLRRALAYASPEWRRLALGVALQVGTVASGIGLMGTSAWLIAKAALHPSIATLSVAIVGVRFFGLSRGVLRYAERLVSHDATLRVLARIREQVYRALEPLAPARLMERRSGDLLVRLVDDVETLEHAYVRVLGPSMSSVAVALLTVVVLAQFSEALVPVVVGGMAIGGVLVPWFAARLGEDSGRRAVAARAALSAHVVDGIQGVADLLALGAGRRHLDRIVEDSRALAASQQRSARSAALGGALVILVADLTAATALAVGVTLVGTGAIDGVDLAVVALVTLASFELIAALPGAYEALGSVRASAGRVSELTDAEPVVRPPSSPTPAPAVHRLDVRGLTFRYPGEPANVLESIDVSVSRGRLVGVVGPSGSGKSTLAHVLLRFWDVPPGCLFADGIDVRDCHPDAWRTRLAFAQQRTHLFTGTLRENLLIGNPSATDATLERAIARVGLGGTVSSFAEGVDTWIGEQGRQLSGGERQRLALARVLLSTAPIVLLDEPTAHLDAATERDLFAEFRRLAAERAVLLITHRLAGLDQADEIVVLDGGRIVDRGRFGELESRAGWFARMLDLQRSVGALDAPI